MRRGPAFRLAVPVLAALLAGCASLDPGQATGEASRRIEPLAGEGVALSRDAADRAAREARVAQWLAAPLAQDDAVRLALVNSPALQSMLAASWAAQAEARQGGRLPNPRLALERLVQGHDVEIGRALSFGLLDLLTLPLRQRAATQAIEAERLRLAQEVLALGLQVRQQWVRAVAAQQLQHYHAEVQEAAEAAAELARRMQAVGNWSRLQRAREQAFHSEASAGLARARQAALAEREALVRLLGLDAAQAQSLRLPERLAELPKQPISAEAVLASAKEDRLDLRLARQRLAAAQRAEGSTRWSSVGDLELAYIRNSETHEPVQRGWELEIALPLFDLGDARRAGASAQTLAALAQLRQVQLETASQLRERYHAWRSAHDIARHYRDELVPLRKTIAEEMLLRYNGMLVGVFELLADAREQRASVIAAIEAQRDFWLADAALEAARLGAPLAPAPLSAPGAAATAPQGH
ncbi:TolC family protein [Caldimonas tepidiphila]|uniref:TolC family protein n=1 Tax=Caldimonas tepidiphila TaxID=2315841 RepID=UPI000E5A1EE6|nr:TolC family protein [Caldimonas tepidiphila]